MLRYIIACIILLVLPIGVGIAQPSSHNLDTPMPSAVVDVLTIESQDELTGAYDRTWQIALLNIQSEFVKRQQWDVMPLDETVTGSIPQD